MENDELAQHLESLQRESCYRVDAVLKESPVEVTQRVFFVGANGAESGPYIRKFIMRDVGMGAVYERLFEAQREGRRFKYLPDILECYARNDRLVVVMEHVTGETLQEVVYRNDPSLDLAIDVFPRLCDAVSELHDEFDPPIIHRDLKPSNIVLAGRSLALIDFGISREYHEGAQSDTTHFGTREFAPPEQFGFGQTTVRSDVYSLGMVLYFCLTETIPDSATRERGFADPRVPEPVRQVIVQATALDPAARFGHASALKTAFLSACAAGRQGAGLPAQQGAPATFGGQAAPTKTSAFVPPAEGPAAGSPEQPQEKQPFQLLGEIWNVFLGIVFLAMLFSAPAKILHPTGGAAANSMTFNYWFLFGYLMPSAAALCILFADKRRLTRKFPRLAGIRWWKWLVGCAVFIALIAFVTILLAGPLGGSSFDYRIVR